MLDRTLCPRSLMGPPVAPADQQTYVALAKMEERHATEHVDGSFESPEAPPGAAEPPVPTATQDPPPVKRESS
jgi:hypothetical protein